MTYHTRIGLNFFSPFIAKSGKKATVQTKNIRTQLWNRASDGFIITLALLKLNVLNVKYEYYYGDSDCGKGISGVKPKWTQVHC